MQSKYFLTILVFLSAHNLTSAQTYNYYFGNIHAHSSYSDGNKDESTSGLSTPYQDFIYAKASQHIDFYGISEHNHQSAGMANTTNFHNGLRDADSATVNGSFIALYGMEWGVISNGGHVIIYGYDSLIGWDSGVYDVFNDEFDYVSLWKKINEKPGSFAYLAHPSTGDYGDILSNAATLSADNAIVGMAGRSGPAFSTNTTYSNPIASDYISFYNNALKMGYHVGVGLDHDTHYSVFGRQSAGRLVVLANSLTKADLMDAFKKMRFYCSDDWNAKVDFNISNQPMGTIFSQAGSPSINVTISDPDASESVSSITMYYGIPGSGNSPSALTPITNSNTATFSPTIANNATYYYYAKIKQADGNFIWTSPIWYTRNDAVTNTAPVCDFSVSSTNSCINLPLTFTDNTTNSPTSWNWQTPGAVPSSSSNQNFYASYPNPGTYTVTLNTTNAFGTSNSVTKTIVIKDEPAASVQDITVCKGSAGTLVATGATTYSWSTGETTSTIQVSPNYSTNYNVLATANGCTKSINTWVTVKPSPTINVTSSTICSGETDTIIASGGTTYSWNTGETTTSIIVHPTATTNYTATGTTNDCSKSVVSTVTVNPCTGIKEITTNQIKIYPNPANDFLMVETPNLSGKKIFEIYNLQGKLLLTKNETKNKSSLDLNKFENGNYVLKIISKDKLYASKQFVVTK